MTISAEIILDSVSVHGKRITTFVLRYPRFIHSEFMTHRALSRNASSSRAIPFTKLVKDTWEDIAYPIEFRANQRGMQAGDPLPPWREKACRAIWATHSYVSGLLSWCIFKLGAHKQYANRLIEPTGHISVVVTATEWANFFALRYHGMAQPEICELAKIMWEASRRSTPTRLMMGEWHLPFVSREEIKHYFTSMGPGVITSNNPAHWQPLINRSVARCARVSFLNHMNGIPTQEEDDGLCARLLGAQPIHASPAEHQATPAWKTGELSDTVPLTASGNFVGWKQYRKTLANENITEFTGP